MNPDIPAPSPTHGADGGKTFPSLEVCLQADIPVIVPTFNNPTYLRNMITQLRGLRFHDVLIVDNASTYPPMMELLAELSHEYRVVLSSTNRGARHVILDEKIYALLPPLFCVTDPDLQFNADLPDDFLAELVCLTEKHAVGKAGFSLDISDRSRLRENGFLIVGKEYKIWEWEEQFWKEPLEQLAGGDQVYRAHVDTTFAVYNKKYFRRETMFEAIRVAGRYTCEHLPWYKDSIVPEAEETFYRRAATKYGNYHRQSAEYASNILLDLYRRRPDLQSAFPEAADGHDSGLRNWACGVCAQKWEDADYETLKPYAEWFTDPGGSKQTG